MKSARRASSIIVPIRLIYKCNCGLFENCLQAFTAPPTCTFSKNNRKLWEERQQRKERQKMSNQITRTKKEVSMEKRCLDPSLLEGALAMTQGSNAVPAQCAQTKCQRRARFNIQGEVLGKFCFAHASLNMVDVKKRVCEHASCFTVPSYKTPGLKPGRFCVVHACKGMIDVRNISCIHPGCKKQPSHSFKGEGRALFCSVHASPGMIDVKSKTWCVGPFG